MNGNFGGLNSKTGDILIYDYRNEEKKSVERQVVRWGEVKHFSVKSLRRKEKKEEIGLTEQFLIDKDIGKDKTTRPVKKMKRFQFAK